MRRHDDPIITCPFDKAHKMPSVRLQWHLARCTAKKFRQEQGLPIFNCKYNFLHIYLDQTELDKHEETCLTRQKITEQLEIEEK